MDILPFAVRNCGSERLFPLREPGAGLIQILNECFQFWSGKGAVQLRRIVSIHRVGQIKGDIHPEQLALRPGKQAEIRRNEVAVIAVLDPGGQHLQSGVHPRQLLSQQAGVGVLMGIAVLIHPGAAQLQPVLIVFIHSYY